MVVADLKQSIVNISLSMIFPQIRREELFNTFSHLGAALLSLIGLLLMVFRSSIANLRMVIPSLIFGISMVALFSSSAYWHSLKQGGSHESKFQKLDEIMIYFMIAGTLTPISVLYIPDPMRNWLLVSMWGLAISGSLLKIFYPPKNRTVITLIYLGMGWMPAVAIQYFVSNMPLPIFFLFFAGAIFYSFGAIVYITRKLVYFHETFHMLVVFGAICHFLVVTLSF